MIRPAAILVPATAMALLVLGASTRGCAKHVASSDEGAYDGPVNSCSSDSSCPTGTCHPDLEICAVSAPADDGNWLVRVTPAASDETPAQVFSVELGEDGAVLTTLDVKTPVMVTAGAGARTSSSSIIQDLNATVVLTDTVNHLPGRSASITVYESSSTALELELLPSTYRIMIMPGSTLATNYPVVFFYDMTLSSNGGFSNSDGDPTDLIIDPGDVTVEGVVLQGEIKENGLEVTAVDPDTGRTISTEDTTGCDTVGTEEICGHFSIKMHSEQQGFSLRVSRPTEPQHPVHLLEGFDISSVIDDEPPVLDLTGDDRLSLPALEVPVRYQGYIEKPVEDGPDGTPVLIPAPDCYAIFKSDNIGGDSAGGSVERSVTSNESGMLEDTVGQPGISLYPGDYTVTIIPAGSLADAKYDYTWFSTDTPVSIEDTIEAVGGNFTLGLRPVVTGLITAGGKRVPGGSIVADTLLDAPDSVRSNTTNCDEDGSFSLWLDEAEYFVVAQAPAESNYAWSADTFTVEGDGTMDRSLEIPFVATGKVAPSADQVDPVDLGGAVIEWFRLHEGKAYQVGRSVADSEGNFTTLLPPLSDL